MRQLLREFWPRFDSTDASLRPLKMRLADGPALREWAQDAALPIKTD
jgi:hypothetical protein